MAETATALIGSEKAEAVNALQKLTSEGKAYVKGTLLPFLEKEGVEVTSISDDYVDFLGVQYRDVPFILSSGDVSDLSALKSFLKRFDKAVEVMEELYDGRKDVPGRDIFYSDIHFSVKRRFGKSKGRHLIYSFICGQLRKKGMQVVS